MLPAWGQWLVETVPEISGKGLFLPDEETVQVSETPVGRDGVYSQVKFNPCLSCLLS